MKSIRIAAPACLLFVLLVSPLFYSIGCDNLCKDVNCVNGKCVDGICECTAGWEGMDCEQWVTKKYEGLFQVTDSCGGNYSAVLTPSSTDSLEFFIDLSPGTELRAVIDGIAQSYQFQIPLQTHGTTTWQGSGSYSMAGTGISFTCTLTDTTTRTCLFELVPN